MPSPARTRTARYAPVAVALLGIAALAPPAGAVVANPSHIIEVVINTSDVLIGGVDGAAVELRRNGVVLNTGAATGAAGSGEAGLNSDHAPGGCWSGFVPQMLPGDEIRNTTNGDSIVLGDVTVTSPITEENGAVVFRGTFAGPLPPLHELDATIEPATEGFRFADGSSGGQFLSAGVGNSGGSITQHPDGTWTARFTGLSGVEKQEALGGEHGASVGLEHDVTTTGGEITAFHFGATPGGHGGCTEPYRPNEVTGFDRAAINALNAGTALVVSGVAQPGVTSVLVTLTDKDGATADQTATPSGAGAWSVAIPAGALADGEVGATVRMTMGPGTFAGVGGSITKDTVAPGAPTADAGPGTYQQGVDVALAGENVRYTTDGSTPTPASQAYSSPLRVSSSQTIKAISVDAAGNASPVASFAYTILAPVVAGGPIGGGDAGNGGSAGSAGAGAATPSSAASVAAPARLRLASLSVRRRMALRSARRNGMRVTLTAPDGAGAVRVALRRNGRTVATVVRRVTGGGVMRVRVPGSRRQRRALRRGTYTVQVTPGSSRSALDGVTSTRRITLR